MRVGEKGAMDFGGFWMKPNFDEMSKAELKAYVLSHRDDEAIRVLFSSDRICNVLRSYSVIKV
jgi:hypothetical protein